MKVILLILIVVFMASCSITLKSSTSNQKPLLVIPTSKNVSIKVQEKVAIDFKKQNKSIEFFWF